MKPSSRLVRLSLISLLMAVVIAVALGGWLDRFGRDSIDSGLTRASSTFALARGLNAVISVVQESQLSLQPAGVGVQLALGQVLDPVNDLIERFSWVMLVAAASFAMQKLLLEVLSWNGISIALTLVSLAWLACLWRPTLPLASQRGLLLRITLLLLLLRLLIPALAAAGEFLHQGFLQQDYLAATARIDRTRQALDQLATAEIPEAGTNEGLLDSLQGLYDQALQSLDLGQRIDAIEAAADQVVQSTIQLIAIFLLQTLLWPLLFLWIMRRAYSGMLWLLSSRRSQGGG